MRGWRGAIKVVSTPIRMVSLFLIGVILSMAIAACNMETRINAAPTKNVELTVASFIVTRNAYKAIIPKFIQKWQTEHNQTVRIYQSYGASGAQTRAVVDGLPADVVHLAMALDTQRIEKAGLIDTGWEKEFPNNGVVSQSVVALATRPGNPKGINSWADLAKDGIKMITADPKTSGVARWNFLALWNAGISNSDNEAKAIDYVTKAYKNAPILSRDAREAADAFFKQGQGDALINYENEIILAKQKGLQVNYVIPDENISIDNTIAVVDANVKKHGNREVVEAFVQYLFTPEAQQEFAKAGFRPVLNDTSASTKELQKLPHTYPPVKNLSQVSEFGGWNQVQKRFFTDGAIFDQIQLKINRSKS